MRKLKFHEKKLLKKVNFLDWKRENNHREAHVMQRYHIVERDDYKKYVVCIEKGPFVLFPDPCFF
jgi:U3 small nucleolar ribonucleoprotein protein IMP3